MWAYFELLRLYTNVWVESINIGTLVVKGFINVNICGRVSSFYRNLCRYQVLCNGTMMIELCEFNNKKK